MKKLYLLLGMVLILQGAMAQNSITGRVTDETGGAFPGVNILVKGSSSGSQTDADGKYTIVVPDANSTLVFSFVGYGVQEALVGTRTSIDIKMALDVQSLNEVVVTALGIAKESKKLGYSATVAKVDEMTKNRTNNMMSSLEGKIAGLDISPPSAGPGASNKIRIRGQSGFAGSDNGPLLIINGLPMSQGADPAQDGKTRDGGDAFMLFNPDDVESMTVLKGATAAALYGSRASNGAIVITTKSGAGSKGLGVELNSNVAFDEVLDFTDFQYEYGQGLGGIRPGKGTVTAAGSGQFSWGERYDDVETVQFDGVLRPYSPNRHYITDFYRTGVTMTNSVAVSNGNENGSFRASYSSSGAKGIVPNNTYDRKIFNINANQKFGQKLTVGASLNYTNENNKNRPEVGFQSPASMNFLLRVSPTTPLWAFEQNNATAVGAEAPTNGFGTTVLNPYFYMPRQFDVVRSDRFLGTVTTKYQFAKWLYAQGRVNANMGFQNSESNTPTGSGSYGTGNLGIYYNNDRNTFNGQYNTSQNMSRDINLEGIIGANHRFGEFSVDGFVAGNMRSTQGRGVNAQSNAFQTRGLYTIGNGTVFSQGQSYSRSEINSIFGSAEFGWKDMIYLNITGRNDWFSILTPGNKSVLQGDNSKFYPSVSGSFIFSELTEQELPWLSYGKLRSSFAVVGNVAGIGEFYGTIPYTYNNQSYLGRTVGSVSANIPNPSISPYNLKEMEVGLELRMFRNKVHVDAAAYKKVTTDQLLNVNTSTASSISSISQNAASLQNQGIEFLVDVNVVNAGNFSWNTSFNTAYNISEVTDLGGPDRLQISTHEFIGRQYYEVGKPIAMNGGRTWARDAAGNILLTDQGRIYVAPGQPEVLYGGALPTFTGGWNNTVRYKNLSLLVHFDYKAGGQLISGTAVNGLRQGHNKASLVGRREGENGVVWDGVYQSGPNAGQKNTTAVFGSDFYTDLKNQNFLDMFVYKSDFIKLRNVTLTYDLSSLVGSQLKFVKGLTLSASCRNALLIKKYVPDVDPEATASTSDQKAGYESTSLPTTRVWGFNVNMKF